MAGFNFKEWIFGGKHFCFCLPTRVGVVIISFLSLVLSALLAIIIWFEVYTTKTLGPKEKAAFVTAGVTETLLLIASILGFSGAIAKKYLFLAIYAYFIYAHFFLNVAIAAYFLYVIENGSDAAIVHGCQQGLKEAQAQEQCEGLLKITKTAYVAVASLVLLIEMYGALVVTRYMRQLRREKRNARSRISAKFRSSHPSQGSEDVGLLMDPVTAPESRQYNPYSHHNDFNTAMMNRGMVPSNTEPGYGGGQWNYQDIYEEEKRAHHTSLSTVEEDITAERASYHEKSSSTTASNMRLPSLGEATSPYSNRQSSTIDLQPPTYHVTPHLTHVAPERKTF